MRVTLEICSKDRHSELSLLMQSLRTQTYQDWDLLILDNSQMPIEDNHFLMCILNKIKYEGHYVRVHRDNSNAGVCYCRNKLIELDTFGNPLCGRIDDDVVLEKDYLYELVEVIKKGYDIASGITPLMIQPTFKRDISLVKPIINLVEFDLEGNLIIYHDDCGYGYNTKETLLANEFRSCCIMRREVTNQIKYPINLSPVGFREEAHFSLKAQWAGFKIGVNTGAIAYHIACPSGGVRSYEYTNNVKSDDEYFRKWAKEQYLKNGQLAR